MSKWVDAWVGERRRGSRSALRSRCGPRALTRATEDTHRYATGGEGQGRRTSEVARRRRSRRGRRHRRRSSTDRRRRRRSARAILVVPRIRKSQRSSMGSVRTRRPKGTRRRSATRFFFLSFFCALGGVSLQICIASFNCDSSCAASPRCALGTCRCLGQSSPGRRQGGSCDSRRPWSPHAVWAARRGMWTAARSAHECKGIARTHG